MQKVMQKIPYQSKLAYQTTLMTRDLIQTNLLLF